MALATFILIATWAAVHRYLRYAENVRPQFRFLAFDVVHECAYIPLIQSIVFAGLMPTLVAGASEAILAFGMFLYAMVMRCFRNALTTAFNVDPWNIPANGLERAEDHLERGHPDHAAQVLFAGPFFKLGLFCWNFVLAWGTYRSALSTDGPWIGLAAHAGINLLLCFACLALGRDHIIERQKQPE